MLTLTGQHEARVFHLNPPHLGLQEELEINAFGLRGGGEKSSRDSRSVFVVLLTKAPGLGRGVAPSARLPWPRLNGMGYFLLAAAPDLGRGVTI